jgi:hypothetical protein
MTLTITKGIYILNLCYEIGYQELSFTELQAWATLTQTELLPFEYTIIIDIMKTYKASVTKYAGNDCDSPPWDGFGEFERVKNEHELMVSKMRTQQAEDEFKQR